MKLATQITVIIAVIFGMGSIFTGSMRLIGVDKLLISDKFNLLIRKQGLVDNETSYKIAQMLALENNDPGLPLIIMGSLLITLSGITLKLINKNGPNQSLHGSGPQ
jgi:hypothetical protein